MLTSFSDDAQIYAALRAGASGYLIKDVSGEALLQAIRAVSRGEPHLHPTITRRLMQLMPPPENPFTALTDREYQILRLIGRGLSNTEIAEALELSREIIARHVGDIFRKLQVTDRAQAIVLAIHYRVTTFEAAVNRSQG